MNHRWIICTLLLCAGAAISAGEEPTRLKTSSGVGAEERPDDFGRQWVRSHPFTLKALTLQGKAVGDNDRYAEAGFSNMLAWKNKPDIFQAAGRQENGNRLRRYTLRIDGFISVNAPLAGGELVTKPLRFEGNQLEINFSTSAAGSVRVEIQDANGDPIPGFTLADCNEQFGDEIDRVVSWKQGTDVSGLSDKTVRLRFEPKDADLYSFQFAEKTKP